jgi:hypothetical protein
MHFPIEDAPEFSKESVCQHGSKEWEEVTEHCKYMVNNSCIVITIQQYVPQVQGKYR